MRGWRSMMAALFVALSAAPALAAPAEVTLTRLDCGFIRANDGSSFSDTHGYDGKAVDLPVSCYLIRHGADYLLWDAGLSTSYIGTKLDDKAPISSTVARSLVDQIKALGLDPAQIGQIAVSHYHLDHVGQASSFPQATLIIGLDDWTAMQGGKRPALVDVDALAPWLLQGGKVKTVARDLDIFGDGSVVMFDTRGHTNGHKSLLVRLAKTGPVLLTGDLYHTRRNYDVGDVSAGNIDRADSLASMDRFRRSAESLHATVVIGHEAADIAKLPAFPKAAD